MKGHTGAWLVKWRLSVPSMRKVVGSTPLHVGTLASPSPIIACMTDVAPCGCLAAKFDSYNSLLSSIHTLLIDILRCVRLCIKQKYYYYYYTRATNHNVYNTCVLMKVSVHIIYD